MSENDISTLIQSRRMTPFQVVVVGICIVISMLDGFDVLAMAFTAPVITREWALDPTALGALFSAGLAGMAIGAVLLSPLADRYGRRASVLFCLALMTVGMLLSAFAQNTAQLFTLRLVTGLGIGSVLATINAIVAEYSSTRRRDFCIGMMTMGYSVGATLGGLISVVLLSNYGWQSVFLLGGILSTILAVVVAVVMPESVDFLLARRPAGALDRINHVLRRLRLAPLESLPPVHAEVSRRSGYRTMFAADMRTPTLLICAGFFLAMMTYYFLLNWIPKILVDLGLTVEGGISGSVVMNVAGVTGGLLLGWNTHRFGLGRLTAAYMVLCVASVVVFGYVPASTVPLLLMVVVIGFFMNGVIVGLYALAATVFPATVRATGTGLALGCGRLGATIGPFVAGVLITQGWSRAAYFVAMALPMLLAAGVISRIVTMRNDAPERVHANWNEAH